MLYVATVSLILTTSECILEVKQVLYGYSWSMRIC